MHTKSRNGENEKGTRNQGCRVYGDSHGFGDSDESPWACGDSMEIFDGM